MKAPLPAFTVLAAFNGEGWGALPAFAALALGASGCFPTYLFDVPDVEASYAYRSELHFERVRLGAPLQNVPVLLELAEADGRILYAPMRDDGQDLRFFAADARTEIPHEIERWDSQGTSLVWVRVPELDATTSIWMYFGSKTAISPQEPGQVWSEYAAAYHLGDDLSHGVIHDSAEGHDGNSHFDSNIQNHCSGNQTFSGNNAVEAQIGQGLRLDGMSAAQVDLSRDAQSFSPEAGGGRTFETWLRRHTPASDGMPFIAEECCLGFAIDTITGAGWTLQSRFGHISCCDWSGDPNPTYQFVTSALPEGASDVSWHYLAVSLDRSLGSLTSYLDGSTTARSQTSLDTSANFLPSMTACIGGSYAEGGGVTSSFDGDLDELRIGKRAFSADWIETQYLSMTDQLVTYPPKPSPAH